jgi:hypothetical protein
MLAFFSALVALACALASARRLAWAVAPTSLDAQWLLDTLRAPSVDALALKRLGREIEAREFPWESALFAAFAQDDAAWEAGVSEQLLELEWLAQRWSRVPRVCASVATSAGFLCASIALMQGLAAETVDPSALLTSALDSLTIGIAGTSFCVAAHLRARHALRARLAAIGRLVDRLRSARLVAGVSVAAT